MQVTLIYPPEESRGAALISNRMSGGDVSYPNFLVILKLHCAHTSLHLRLRSTLGSLNMMCNRVINWFSLTKMSPSLETVFVVWKVREEVDIVIVRLSLRV